MVYLKPFVENPPDFPGRAQPLPPPIEVLGALEFEVEAILDKKRVRGMDKYLVKWKGYDEHENTWEPLENLENASERLREFNARQRDRGRRVRN